MTDQYLYTLTSKSLKTTVTEHTSAQIRRLLETLWFSGIFPFFFILILFYENPRGGASLSPPSASASLCGNCVEVEKWHSK
jgi:hypothetical protein